MGIGRDWIRSHPMSISADNIEMANPPTAWMDQYFDFVPVVMLHYGAFDDLPTWLAHRPDAPWIVWVGRDGKFGGSIYDGSVHSGRIGYQVGDEPENTNELAETQQGIAAIKTVDPDALCIIDMGPGANQWLCNQAASIADVLTCNAYRLGKDLYGIINRTRSAALDNDIPYWAWLGSNGQESDLWWTAMSHLAFGFTGFSWFVYQANVVPEWVNFFETPNDYASPVTPSWTVVKEINQTLARFGSWMPWVYSRNIRYITPCQGWFCKTGGLSRWSSNIGPYTTAIETLDGADFLFSHLQSVIDQDSYIMLQNCRHAGGKDQYTSGSQSARVRLTFENAVPNARLRMFNQDDGTIGEQPIVGDKVTFDIPAGRLMAFKYDTGLPWAGIET